MRTKFLLLLLLSLPAGTQASRAESIASPSGALALSVDPSGAYQLSAPAPGWKFAGSLPGPLRHLAITHGHDRVGGYHQIAFAFQEAGQPMTAFIRLYDDRDLALFSRTALNAADDPVRKVIVIV